MHFVESVRENLYVDSYSECLVFFPQFVFLGSDLVQEIQDLCLLTISANFLRVEAVTAGPSSSRPF